MSGGGEEYLLSERVLTRAAANYWRNRNRVMRDRLIPIKQRREEIKLRSVQGAG